RTPLAGSADLICVIFSTVSSIATSMAQDWSTTRCLLTSCAGVRGSTRPRGLPTTLRISPTAFAPPCLFRDLESNKASISPRGYQTFEDGGDSILTPEDQWKYTTAT